MDANVRAYQSKNTPTDRMIYYLHKHYCRTDVYGQEHIPSSPFILCSNHSSHLDTTALIFASQLDHINFSILAAKDYFYGNNTFRKIIPNLLFNIIPVPRDGEYRSLSQCIRKALQQINIGKSLIIYPEGTRNIGSQLLPFERGFAAISLLSRIPILPAYIKGSSLALGKHEYIPKPQRILVKFSKPIQTYPLAESKISIKEKQDELLYRTKSAITALMETA